MRKQIVLIVSRLFPQTMTEAGAQTFFKESVLMKKKLHTIRSGFDKWNINAEKMQRGGYVLSLRQWSGRPYHSEQVEFTQLTEMHVQRIKLCLDSSNDTVTAFIDGKQFFDPDCATIARNDGVTVEQFKEWFFGKDRSQDKAFNGVIIHFTPFSY